MKLHIYLFRHSQTYFNKYHRFCGWMDSKLTPEGIKDAKKLSEKMKKLKIGIGFQSRLSRSKDTLKYVLKNHPECKKIITDDRIIERCYGDLQGKYHKTITKKYGQKQFDIWHRSYDTAPPKGESVKIIEKRVKSFIKDLIKLMQKEKVNVAIAAHGNSMRPFRRYFEKLTIKEMMKLENPYDNYFDYTILVKG